MTKIWFEGENIEAALNLVYFTLSIQGHSVIVVGNHLEVNWLIPDLNCFKERVDE